MIPEIELQTSGRIKAFQEEKLKEMLRYVYQHSPFYQKHFAQHRIAPEQINQLEDLSGIPTTTKDDLQQNNWDFLCVPKNKIIEYTSTSGTLGKPVTIGLTERICSVLPTMNRYRSLAPMVARLIFINLC